MEHIFFHFFSYRICTWEVEDKDEQELANMPLPGKRAQKKGGRKKGGRKEQMK